GSYAYYIVADNIRGPYQPINNMLVMNGCAEDYAHVSQTGFFFNVKGSKQETVVYCGDRWADFAGNGLGYNQWVPLSFEGKTPYFNSLSSWNLNSKTGEWKVGEDNNYIKNGSFEADRKNIPSPVKPVQEQLTGWISVVIQGNRISLDSSVSPVLNHINTETERKVVIGERSLSLTDKVYFKRKVYQVAQSTPFTKLPKGKYILTATVKNSSGFKSLEMYANSNGKTRKYSIKGENSTWKKISIQNIIISNDKVEVGFIADGGDNNFCYVDDVSLVKQK
ncbi:MAG: beta-xylosidase, partial [Candidatus Dadabacteria bacterium]